MDNCSAVFAVTVVVPVARVNAVPDDVVQVKEDAPSVSVRLATPLLPLYDRTLTVCMKSSLLLLTEF